MSKIPAAAYVRMSSDQQVDSPERQKAELEKLAEREGCRVVEWYSDHGMTGTESKKRKGFQRMLVDAKAGKFKAILLAEQSRMSREDPLDAMEHWRKLRDAGVAVYTCQRFTDIAGLVMAVIDAHGAHDESLKIADRSVSGKRVKLARGERVMGGIKPLGYDREFTDESGKVVAVVECRENFRKPQGWKSRLVISKNAADVAAVRNIFDQFCAGASISSITRNLNRSKIRVRHRPCDPNYLWRILANPVYAGDTVLSGQNRGKFRSLMESGEVYCMRDTHEPLISREQFDRVQSLLAKRPKNSGKRFNKYLLTGLIRCAGCKRAAIGYTRNNRVTRGKNYKGVWRYYRCSMKCHVLCRDFCSDSFNVSAENLEGLVMEVVKSALTMPESKKAIADAIKRRGRGVPERTAARLETKLAELRDQITKVTRNLALADPESVPALNALLAGWRGEAAEVDAQIASITHTRKLAPESQAAVNNLSALLDRIEQADRDRLAQALSAIIKSVYVARRKTADGCWMVTHGWIELQPGMGVERVDFDRQDKMPIAKWPLVAAFLRKSYPRPLKMDEIAEAIGMKLRNCRKQVAVAVRNGVVGKNPHGSGWLAKL